jgi:hypothetical protein
VLTEWVFVDDLDTGHHCSGGAFPHPRNDSLDGVRITFQRGLDRTVVVVSYPTGDTNGERFPLTALPEEHALHMAFDNDASPDHVLIFTVGE